MGVADIMVRRVPLLFLRALRVLQLLVPPFPAPPKLLSITAQWLLLPCRRGLCSPRRKHPVMAQVGEHQAV